MNTNTALVNSLPLTEDFYRSVVEISVDGIIIIDSMGRYRYANPSYLKICGYSSEELIGAHFTQFVPEHKIPATAEIFMKVLANPGQCVPFEVEYVRKDGIQRLIEGTAMLLPDGNLIAYSRDITDKRRLEKALCAIVEGTSAVTGAGFFNSLAQYLSQALNVSHAMVTELVGQDAKQVRTLAVFGDGQFLENREYYLNNTPCEKVIANAIGYHPVNVQSLFPMDMTITELSAESYMGVPMRDANGKVLGHIAILDHRPMRDEELQRNILQIFAVRASVELQRQSAENRLRESEEYFRSLIENSNDAISILTPDGIVRYTNPSMEVMLGFSHAEMIGQSFEPYFDPEDLTLVTQYFNQLLAQPGIPHRTELRARHKDGRKITIENVAQLYPSGKIISNCRDITERKMAEEKLRESEARFRTLIENAPEIIIIFDADQDKIIDASQTAPEFFGLTRDQLLTTSPIELSPQSQPDGRLSTEASRLYIEQALNGQTAIFEWVHCNALTRQEIPCEVRLVRLPSAGRHLVRGSITDITARKEAELALLKLNAELEKRVEERTAESMRLTAIIEATTDFVGVSDLQGNIVYVNRAGKRMVGWSDNEDISIYKIQDLLTPDFMVRVSHEVIPTLLDKGNWLGEGAFKHRDGHEIPLSIDGLLLYAPDGTPKYLAGIHRDISEQKRVQAELTAAKEAAESATRAKSTFLATMSHEIRTPMNAVIGMTSLLQQSPLNDKQQDLVATIHSAGESLLTIINDILDFSKIEAGKLELESKPFNLSQCLNAVNQLLAPRVNEKGLTLNFSLDPMLPDGIIGDSTRVRQILLNLIGNAVKFTDKGEINVMVTVVSQPLEMNGFATASRPLNPRAMHLHFTVRDSGIGIPPAKMDKLFQSFSQLDASTTREYGGTGLGLAISKRLAELMGGKMWAESAGDGQGSTFYFTIATEAVITMPAPAAERIAPVLDCNPKSLKQPLRILLAEDVALNRKFALLALEDLGLSAEVAVNGREACNLLAAREFDIVFMDVQMPIMDGLSATREIRRFNGTVKQPYIIAMTANAMQGDREMCLEAGMNDYISKPIDLDELKIVLEKAGQTMGKHTRE